MKKSASTRGKYYVSTFDMFHSSYPKSKVTDPDVKSSYYHPEITSRFKT